MKKITFKNGETIHINNADYQILVNLKFGLGSDTDLITLYTWDSDKGESLPLKTIWMSEIFYIV